jgi:4-hydroxybenzoate polyprenyltransferase
MKNYLKLIRVHHWVKNGLIFLPLIFSGQLLHIPLLTVTLLGFFAFCLLSSFVYVLNDIKDIEQDRQHPIKKNRPLAAGKIPLHSAKIILAALIVFAAVLLFPSCKTGWGWLFASIYLAVNLCYSNGAKNVPLLDIVLLVSGFVLRVLFGSAITGIDISNWLYLTVFASCTYLALGKRRNEYRLSRLTPQDIDSPLTRNVLMFYNYEFLDKNMHICLGLAITFYALWCVDPLTAAKIGNPYLIWTVPLLMILGMKYSLNVEQESDGDPVEVILHDKVLLALSLLLAGIVGVIIYF